MNFSTKIILLRIVPGNGSLPPVTEKEYAVWADVRDVGATTKFTAAAANTKVDLQAVMYRYEFDGYTHAEIDGVRYKIEKTGLAKKEMHIKLILSKAN